MRSARSIVTVMMALLAAGCGGGPRVGPIERAELVKQETIAGLAVVPSGILALPGAGLDVRTPAGHLPELDAARSEGRIAGWSVRELPAPESGETMHLVEVNGLVGGDVERVLVAYAWAGGATTSIGGRQDASFRCVAATLFLRSSSVLDSDLAALGLRLERLSHLAPALGGAVYETSRDGWSALVAPGPRLTAVMRGPAATLQRMHGLERWAAVRSRLQDGMRLSADPQQVLAVLAATAGIPLEADREAAAKLTAPWLQRLERTAAEALDGWDGLGFAARWRAAVTAHDQARALAAIPGAQRLGEMARTLAGKAMAAVPASAGPAERAGMALLRERLGDTGAGAAEALRTLAEPLLPEPEGPSELLAKVKDRAWLAARPVARAQRSAAASPRLAVTIGLDEGALTMRSEPSAVAVSFTIPNPAWEEWRLELERLAGEVAKAESVAASTSNYTRTYDRPFTRRSGDYVVTGTERVTETNHVMQAQHEHAKAETQRLRGLHDAYRATEPAMRLSRQDSYAAAAQYWTGSRTRRIALGSVSRTLSADTSPTPRLRTAGWTHPQALPSETGPHAARDEWTDEAGMRRELAGMLDNAATAAMPALMDSWLSERIEASRPTPAERAWARLILLGERDANLPHDLLLTGTP